MFLYVLALSIGIVAGLRAMTPLAAISWVAYSGSLSLENTWLAILGFAYTPYVLTLFATAELLTDKHPKTPSRKTFMPFAARIVSGALCGAALGAEASNVPASSFVMGAIGGVIGTLVGYALRVRLTAAVGGRGLLIALIEDAIAIFGAIAIVAIAVAR